MHFSQGNSHSDWRKSSVENWTTATIRHTPHRPCLRPRRICACKPVQSRDPQWRCGAVWPALKGLKSSREQSTDAHNVDELVRCEAALQHRARGQPHADGRGALAVRRLRDRIDPRCLQTRVTAYDCSILKPLETCRAPRHALAVSMQLVGYTLAKHARTPARTERPNQPAAVGDRMDVGKDRPAPSLTFCALGRWPRRLLRPGGSHSPPECTNALDSMAHGSGAVYRSFHFVDGQGNR